MTDLVEETNKYWFKAKYLREKNEPITEIKPDNSESNPSESQSTGPIPRSRGTAHEGEGELSVNPSVSK